ncbi:MAG: hypothetical protein J07HB67_00383 [halophilic archaeon J07HB67]|jgi:hypothetical protein|nr:MAG: hypothetical protein J07HB67_00383 [halophilic archaeon J07HB67]
MVERRDPARTGVVAGRGVGVVTALVSVAVVFLGDGGPYAATARALEAAGVGEAVTAVVAVDALTTAVVRYGACYVVGSLLGVVYGWLDRHREVVLGGAASVVGVVDAAVSLRSPVLAVVCLLAWVGFVPVFLRLTPDAEPDREGPLRLG